MVEAQTTNPDLRHKGNFVRAALVGIPAGFITHHGSRERGVEGTELQFVWFFSLFRS